MSPSELESLLTQAMPSPPTGHQVAAIREFCRFLLSKDAQSLFILRGFAGTGKTTLAAAMVRAMTLLHQKVVLLAPTGRAAKVFATYAGHAAYTIHRRIYRQKTFAGENTAFGLNFNSSKDTFFFVDEASMIGNASEGGLFGTGCLLDDLMQFVYHGGAEGCRLVFMGDTAQLPPVGSEGSPALDSQAMSRYGMTVFGADLREVVRQGEDTGILWNASAIREYITREETTRLPQIRLKGFADVQVVRGDELIETLSGSYANVGTDDTIVITRSNKRAIVYNRGIRNTVLDRDEMLCGGDRLMIVKNNYHWLKPQKGEDTTLSFLANGDTAIVRRVRNIHELYGFTFAEATLTLPDYGDHELTATVLLDTLMSEAPALTRDESERLFRNVNDDYALEPGSSHTKKELMEKVREDNYYNALQIKYAYAITCHKAQGGQWAHVYLDQGYMTDDMLSPDYIHWLYTAFTRATEKLFLVNWPETQIEKTDS